MYSVIPSCPRLQTPPTWTVPASARPRPPSYHPHPPRSHSNNASYRVSSHPLTHHLLDSPPLGCVTMWYRRCYGPSTRKRWGCGAKKPSSPARTQRLRSPVDQHRVHRFGTVEEVQASDTAPSLVVGNRPRRTVCQTSHHSQKHTSHSRQYGVGPPQN